MLFGLSLKEVDGYLLVVDRTNNFKYVRGTGVSFAWRMRSDEARSLEASGTPSCGGGVSSKQQAAIAASHHPCYKEMVDALQKREGLEKTHLTNYREPDKLTCGRRQGWTGSGSASGTVGVTRTQRGDWKVRCHACGHRQGDDGYVGTFESQHQATAALEQHKCTLEMAQKEVSAVTMPSDFAKRAAKSLEIPLEQKRGHVADWGDDYKHTTRQTYYEANRSRPWRAQINSQSHAKRHLGTYRSSAEAALYAGYMLKFNKDLRDVYTYSPDVLPPPPPQLQAGQPRQSSHLTPPPPPPQPRQTDRAVLAAAAAGRQAAAAAATSCRRRHSRSRRAVAGYLLPQRAAGTASVAGLTPSTTSPSRGPRWRRPTTRPTRRSGRRRPTRMPTRSSRKGRCG